MGALLYFGITVTFLALKIKSFIKGYFNENSYWNSQISSSDYTIVTTYKKYHSKLKIDTQKVIIIDPIGYLNMVWLIDSCSLVMTNSEELQKEAYFFKVPSITLREDLEWVEFIIVVGTKKIRTLNAIQFIQSSLANDDHDFL